MKKLKKILLWVLTILVIIVGSVVGYFKFYLPNVGELVEIKIEGTPQQIARGEYLANHVAVCMDCHSERDWTKFSGPPKDETLGMGGELFDQRFGFPGTYYAKNITPTGISRYSDAELFRAITTGVNKEGESLFPVMPSSYYGQMDKEDIVAIIAYIRTLKPLKNKWPESSSDFPMSLIINTIPHEASFTKRPEKTDVVNYGKYLASAASCVECHTQSDHGTLVAGSEFAGGREFPFPNGSIVRSKNITPDKETGIGTWTEDMFVDMFQSRSESEIGNTKLNSSDFNTIMPWTMYADMNEEDLKAIYAYLKTIKPIKNPVEMFTSVASK